LCSWGCFGHEDKVFEKRWWYLFNCGWPRLRDCDPTMSFGTGVELMHLSSEAWQCSCVVL
jgi:hypothetical protein